MEYNYYIIDAFTDSRFQGAQVAVFPLAEDLSEQRMQQIASEISLPETVFIFSRDRSPNEWAIRVFSPQQEIQYSGHPTIAAAYVLAVEDRISGNQAVLHQADELIELQVFKSADHIERIAFSISASARLDDYVPSLQELAEIIGVDESSLDFTEYQPMIASYGDNFLIIPLKSQAALRGAKFNQNKWTMSFVASLASRILLFTENKTEVGVDYLGRLLGKGIAENVDSPIGPAVPAFGVYQLAGAADGQHKVVIQRGGGGLRKSVIEVEVRIEQQQITGIQLGGQAVISGRGQLLLGE